MCQQPLLMVGLVLAMLLIVGTLLCLLLGGPDAEDQNRSLQ